jgi:hypothetical protein
MGARRAAKAIAVRKPLTVSAPLPQGAAIALMAAKTGFGPWALGAILIGVGTALVHPAAARPGG